eukprot:scaffold76633_cov30-Prasinocladus_malaysianus.AAC.2
MDTDLGASTRRCHDGGPHSCRCVRLRTKFVPYVLLKTVLPSPTISAVPPKRSHIQPYGQAGF